MHALYLPCRPAGSRSDRVTCWVAGCWWGLVAPVLVPSSSCHRTRVSPYPSLTICFPTFATPFVAAVAGVSFAWTVIISVMRGALDSGKVAAAAPTTAQLEDAVASVAAAAVSTTAAADSLEQPAAAAAQVVQATAAAPAHAPVIAAGEVQRSQAAAGLKALVVPRATAHAEAAT
jgi:hypothetical protein